MDKKYSFEYLGEKINGKGDKYFAIVINDGSGIGQQGVDVTYHYFVITKDKYIKRLNYMSVPTFSVKPNKQEATELADIVTRELNGLIPYNVEILNT